MEKIYNELYVIFEDVRQLLYDVGRYNPGIGDEGKRSLPVIATTMGTLATQLNSLRVDTWRIHEKEQLDEHTSNS